MFPKTYSGDSAPRGLISLVQKLVPQLLEGTHPALEILREQFRLARIDHVELTGAGFYVDFDVPSDAPLCDPPDFTGGDARIILKDAAIDAGCVLFVRDGRLATLEGYTYDEPWPEEDDAVLAIEDVCPIVPG